MDKAFKILLICLLLFYASVAYAATYDVCDSGCDYTTIQGCENGVSRGDVCSVLGATYTADERITVNLAESGTSTITFECGSGTCNIEGFIVNSDYVTITGFDIENSTRNYFGIQINTSDNAYISDNYIHDTPARGIFLWTSNNNTVTGNKIERCAEIGIRVDGGNNLIEYNEIIDIRNTIKSLTPHSTQADGFRFYNSTGTANTFRGNYVYDMYYANQNYSGEPPHMDCFQGYDTAGALIEQNHCVMNDDAVHSNTSMHGLMLQSPNANMIITNNIFEVHGFMNVYTGSQNLYIYNNTIRGKLSHWDDPYVSYAFQVEGSVSGVYVAKNNITVDFEYHYRKIGSPSVTITADYNCMFNSDDTAVTNDGITPTNSVEADALFVLEWSDLALQSGSPAIGAGADLGNSLSYGLDPSSTWPDNVIPLNQDDYGDWEIGAYVYVEEIGIKGITISRIK